MKSMNDTVHAVVGDILVMGLHYLTNDKTTVKCMVTKDNWLICYLNFVSNTLKNHGCEIYNALVHFPIVLKTSCQSF